jgi:hypothetical protein
MTVAVISFRFGSTNRGLAEKASKGAEKSCLRTRRRKRGLRKGKRRSRECHSRRSAPAATSSPNIDRSIKHKVRMLDWNKAVADRFSKAIKLYYEKGTFTPGTPRGIGWAKLEARWSCLHGMMASPAKGGVKLNADSALCHSFVSFVEDCVGLYVMPRKGRLPGAGSFAALLQRADLPRRTDSGSRRNRPSGTIESGVLSHGRQSRDGRIMCRACGMQFIPRGETCTVCYARRHGLDGLSGRGGSVLPTRKR